ncbi:Uncharacterized protein Rs2_21859 [Raphanus sativus]|nr:Uncharacterized protein Rs2_21859 [Raphanus sativus]
MSQSSIILSDLKDGRVLPLYILLLDAKFIRVLIINIKELSPAALDMSMVLDSRQNSNEEPLHQMIASSEETLIGKWHRTRSESYKLSVSSPAFFICVHHKLCLHEQ